MTREEAIEKLHWFALDNRDKQIIDTAIEVLTSQNLTKPNNTCEVDLISRADAIELCAEAQGRASTKSELKGISKVWQGLLKLPSAEAEWIPCSERLPEEKQEVYVTVYFIEGDTGRAYGYMDGFGRWHLYSTVEGTLNSGYEVTAWMPLPPSYRGK